MAPIRLLLSWVLLFVLAALAIPIARREVSNLDNLPAVPAQKEPQPASRPTNKLQKRKHYGGWVLDNGVWLYDAKKDYEGDVFLGPNLPAEAFTIQSKIKRNFDLQNIWQRIKGTWYTIKSSVTETWTNFKTVASNIWNRVVHGKTVEPWKSGVPEYDDPNSPLYNHVSPKGSLYTMDYGIPGDADPGRRNRGDEKSNEKLPKISQDDVDDGFAEIDPTLNLQKAKKYGIEPWKLINPSTGRPLRVVDPIPMTDEECTEADAKCAKLAANRPPLGLSESAKEQKLRTSYKAFHPDPSPSSSTDSLPSIVGPEEEKSPSKFVEIIKKPFKAIPALFKHKDESTDTVIHYDIHHVENASRTSSISSAAGTESEDDVGRPPRPTAYAADDSPRWMFPEWGTPDEDLLFPEELELINPENPFGYFQRPDPFEADLDKQAHIAAERAKQASIEAKKAREEAYEARKKAILSLIPPPLPQDKESAPASAPAAAAVPVKAKAPQKPKEVIVGPAAPLPPKVKADKGKKNEATVNAAPLPPAPNAPKVDGVKTDAGKKSEAIFNPLPLIPAIANPAPLPPAPNAPKVEGGLKIDTRKKSEAILNPLPLTPAPNAPKVDSLKTDKGKPKEVIANPAPPPPTPKAPEVEAGKTDKGKEKETIAGPSAPHPPTPKVEAVKTDGGKEKETIVGPAARPARPKLTLEIPKYEGPIPVEVKFDKATEKQAVAGPSAPRPRPPTPAPPRAPSPKVEVAKTDKGKEKEIIVGPVIPRPTTPKMEGVTDKGKEKEVSTGRPAASSWASAASAWIPWSGSGSPTKPETIASPTKQETVVTRPRKPSPFFAIFSDDSSGSE